MPWLLVGVGLGTVMRAHADDRPFLRTTHALASEDEDGWEVSVMGMGNRHGQSLSTQIEHDLSATHRIEVEFGGSANARSPEPERGLRLRSLWRSPTPSGWGWATKLGLEPGRSGQGVGEGQRTQALGVLSWRPAEGHWVHLNLGWQWRQGAGRTATHALAWQSEWGPSRGVYAEAAGTGDGRDRVLHMGLRHWLLAQRVALDTGLGRQSGHERPGDFWVVNLNFFDLDF